MRLDADDCRSRFAAARHAYLATADADSVPHLVPVTFALISAAGSTPDGAAADAGTGPPPGDEVVVAIDHKPKTTRDLKRLRNLAENPRVAFLVDRYDDDWAHLWWVRGDGVATVEHVGEPRAAALDALAARYPQYHERRPDGPLIRVRVTRWSGWAHG
ncbi:PPOX class probable F420-dependent enzyme, Rv0121 family [Promicromonospora umidemergens]|uniref:TIGR03668 family PPOX class F420-dependent oxidoreductase n=1 Tax=Promicromonospora umidemergens TaxID=629679 RepID=A0ABP8XEF7_9MICO|nr:TIGR03668 family PPOX class F420-dependent oxidoreductase [Promicromonospora umidemergens]MCP2283044.1 PPOX class probable F420-dependent enzyme, Rv0121 family [Promicromonospora umidemergens]